MIRFKASVFVPQLNECTVPDAISLVPRHGNIVTKKKKFEK